MGSLNRKWKKIVTVLLCAAILGFAGNLYATETKVMAAQENQNNKAIIHEDEDYITEGQDYVCYAMTIIKIRNHCLFAEDLRYGEETLIAEAVTGEKCVRWQDKILYVTSGEQQFLLNAYDINRRSTDVVGVLPVGDAPEAEQRFLYIIVYGVYRDVFLYTVQAFDTHYLYGYDLADGTGRILSEDMDEKHLMAACGSVITVSYNIDKSLTGAIKGIRPLYICSVDGSDLRTLSERCSMVYMFESYVRDGLLSFLEYSENYDECRLRTYDLNAQDFLEDRALDQLWYASHGCFLSKDGILLSDGKILSVPEGSEPFRRGETYYYFKDDGENDFQLFRWDAEQNEWEPYASFTLENLYLPGMNGWTIWFDANNNLIVTYMVTENSTNGEPGIQNIKSYDYVIVLDREEIR